MHENRGAGHAVDIVVAVDEDFATRGNGGGDALGGPSGAGQGFRVEEPDEFRIEKLTNFVGRFDAPAHEQLGHDRRHARGASQRGDTRGVVGGDAPMFAAMLAGHTVAVTGASSLIWGIASGKSRSLEGINLPAAGACEASY